MSQVSQRSRVRQRALLIPPDREPRSCEILVESQDVAADRSLYDREAYGVRIADRSLCEALDPTSRGQVIFMSRKVDGYAWARVDHVESAQRGIEPRPEQGEPVDLGDDQVRRYEWNASLDGLPKRPIRVGVILVAPAA